MFASRRANRPANTNGHDPAAPSAIGAGELPPQPPAPPAALEAMARRFLGVSFSELQQIGSQVGNFISEARAKIEHIEAQNTAIMNALGIDPQQLNELRAKVAGGADPLGLVAPHPKAPPDE